MNPIYLTMPAAAACNFVSIFPVGSPCLLMAFSAARVKPMEMVRSISTHAHFKTHSKSGDIGRVDCIP